MNGGVVGAWLLHCADPCGSRREPPRRMLGPDAARELVAQADAHGVLPAVLRNFPPFSGDPAFAAAKAEGQARYRGARAFVLMLGAEHQAIMTAAAGLPMAAIKGPVFAQKIYPAPELRTFTDIDLLVAPAAQPRLAVLLAAHGFELADDGGASVRNEWKWVKREHQTLMIEVHTDVVHAPSLRSSLSLTFDDLGDDIETPAGCLLIAIVHGAFSHGFERIQHIVDVCQAARALASVEDERRFETLVERIGARYAAAVSLDLAGRMLAERRCDEIARGLGPQSRVAIARLLIDRSVVTSTKTSRRVFHSWRRQMFRELLKRGRGIPASSLRRSP
jgi:Uncharacterised nucleotidyltransferase